jgi:hypothetical protein
MKRGICMLCLLDKDLQESHLMPRSLTLYIRDIDSLLLSALLGRSTGVLGLKSSRSWPGSPSKFILHHSLLKARIKVSLYRKTDRTGLP